MLRKCECVVVAETKDHLNWELIGELADNFDAEEAELLKDAYDQVEDEEDEHLYHTQGCVSYGFNLSTWRLFSRRLRKLKT